MMIEDDEFPDSWELMKINEVIDSSLYGCNPKKGEEVEGIPYLRISDIGQDGGLNNYPLPEKAKFDSNEKSNKFLLQEGDVVIARSGASSGQSYVYNPKHGDMVYASYLIRFRLDTQTVSKGYIRQYLRSPLYWSQVQSAEKGAAQNNINAESIKDFIIPVPQLDEQERIVEAVEERLERVERLEKSVENIDRLSGEYNEGLVLSLMYGGTKKQASIPTDGDDLPEDWEVVSIKDVSQVETGGTPKTSVDDYWDGDITWIRVSDMPDGMYVSESEDKITENGLKEGSCSLIPKGGVILSTRATIGEVAIADDDLATNQGFKSIIPESQLESKYLAYYLDSITEYLESLGKGATYDEINKSQVQNLKIPLPPAEEQKKIVDIIESFDSERLRVAVDSVGELFNEYRKSLLSKAFQGKINP